MKAYISMLVAALFAYAAPAAAELTTFAAFQPMSSKHALVYTSMTSGGGTLTNSADNKYSFSFLDGVQGISSIFTMSAMSSSASTISGTSYTQSPFSGYFSFVYSGTSDLVIGGVHYGTGATLLRADFSNAALMGTTGSTSSGVTAADATLQSQASSIVFSSDIMSFDPSSARDFSLALTSIKLTPSGSFDASFTGSASTNPVLPAVPEATTWAMMILGMGAVGFTMRSRRQSVRLVALAA